jgi:hypothetical protein
VSNDLLAAERTEDYGKIVGLPTAAQPEVVAYPSPPGVEGTQALAREASGPTRGTPEETPEARADRMILAMTKTGISHMDISVALEREIGGIWRTDYIEKRIRVR